MNTARNFRKNPLADRQHGEKISLLSFDLDGTLLNGALDITPRTLEAICRAAQKGVKLTIASGRAPLMMALYARLIGLEGPYISANGALIQTMDRQVLYQSPIPETEVSAICRFCRENEIQFALLCERSAYFTSGNPRIAFFDRYAALCREHVFPVPVWKSIDWNLAGYTGENVYKILVCPNDDNQSRALMCHLASDSAVTYVFSGRGLLDITAKGIDKGAGLKRVSDYYGIPLDEVCVFGDYDNDIRIFERAGISVAMGNASPKLKKLADFHTAGNEDEGIALALESLEEYYQ
ncbi:MAG: HAD family hydrolase [Oscillospiraceae bacterium]|nr:HAD family hydrolase [Oscillospiraceae bacterium]